MPDHMTRRYHMAGRGAVTLVFLMTGAVLPLAPAPVAAQVSAVRDYAIAAQPLAAALVRFSETSGRQVVADGELLRGRTTGGVTGSYADDAALVRLLAGTGLTWRFSGEAVIIQAAPESSEARQLQPLVVTSAVPASDKPYETAAPVAHIGGDTIQRFRGSSPADIFRGVPGVMSGEARNGAGSIDVNIRGMQGMGRVATTIDGAENVVTVYQGYQGVSNRTFVDPDLLAEVDITKGSDVSSFGTAGTVAMRTLSAADIVDEGEEFGVRLKGGFGTNTSSPKAGDTSGYAWPSNSPAAPTASPTGLDRPGWAEPTSGSGSAVAAYRDADIDLLAAYAYRKQGNYHAGSHGAAATVTNLGPGEYCTSWGSCSQVDDRYENGGIANYRAGEEVLNTELETTSWLGKAGLRFGDGHAVQLGYTGFRSEAGDRIASRLTGETSQAVQLGQTAGTWLDTGTVNYRWKPEGEPLVDLKANLYWSHLELRNPLRTGWRPPQPGDFRAGSDTDMWGAEITNVSRIATGLGDTTLTYGLSYRGEDTRPGNGTREAETWLDYRDARRDEAAGFAKAAWQATDWLTVNGGLRYQYFWTRDRNDPYLERGYDYDARFSDGGFSPSLGVTVEPVDGTQFYVNYSNVMRAPSLIESASAFTMGVNPDVTPERSRNWELGVNQHLRGVLDPADDAMVKLSYFNWDVTDYIAREWYYNTQHNYWSMHIYNMDRAKFEGLELSGRYRQAGFTAEFSANYYLNVEFCRTADSCVDTSLYGDYSTNHVPPEYSADLTLSQLLFDDMLTLGGRVSHIGPRAIGHGDPTAQGASQFISQVNWKPYTLVDLFADVEINENLTTSLSVMNLTDRYYVDPLGLVNQPGPGRTLYMSATVKF